jgi:hypothetical protein
MGLHSAVATLAPGQNGHVSLAFDSQGVTLVVTPQAADGSAAMAQISVIQGNVAAATAKALRLAVAASNAANTYVGFAMASRPARLSRVTPGAYTVCAVPVPASVVGRGALFTYIAQNSANLSAFCVPKTVTDDPPEQPVVVPVAVPSDAAAGSSGGGGH